MGKLREVADRAGLRNVPTQALVAFMVVAAAVVIWGALRWLPGADDAVFVSGDGGDAAVAVAGDPAAEAPADTPADKILVHVVGSIRRPGVYVLEVGDRAVDAVEAAGGMLPDAVASAVNMARPVADGEQIWVPSEDEVAEGAAPPGAAGDSGSGGGGTVNINTADAVALEALPGVGPSTAAKIVADREANGPFASVDDLQRVAGIGPKKLESLRDMASAQ